MCIQEQSLSSQRCLAPVRGGVSNSLLRWQQGAQGGEAHSLPHAQVAGDNTRPAERARQDPLGTPAPDATQRGEASDHLAVRERGKFSQAQAPAPDSLGGRDRAIGFAGGELEGAKLSHGRLGQPASGQAVDHVAVDGMLLAKDLRQTATHRGGPAQITLLRRNAPNKCG